MTLKLRLAAVSLLGLCFVNSAFGQVIVVPSAQTNVEGNSNNCFPYAIGSAGVDSQRYQQVYGSGDFGVGGPRFITELRFRPDDTFGNPFNLTIDNITISFSTTSVAPDALSTTFANNVGANETVVYNGSLTISSADVGGAPRDFDIVVTLQTPYVYDPAAGNLLMDVRNFTGGIGTFFDSQDSVGDAVSRVATTFSGVNGLTADFSDSSGLITQFTQTPVPEPTSLVLLGGVAGAAWLRRKRR